MCWEDRSHVSEGANADPEPQIIQKNLLSVCSELNSNRFEVSHVHKVECVVPWLNDTLVFFTISLQLCQQLKDKVGSDGGGGRAFNSFRRNLKTAKSCIRLRREARTPLTQRSASFSPQRGEAEFQ